MKDKMKDKIIGEKGDYDYYDAAVMCYNEKREEEKNKKWKKHKKIIEKYFMYKPLWHELTEAEAKELFSILEQAKNDKY